MSRKPIAVANRFGWDSELVGRANSFASRPITPRRKSLRDFAISRPFAKRMPNCRDRLRFGQVSKRGPFRLTPPMIAFRVCSATSGASKVHALCRRTRNCAYCQCTHPWPVRIGSSAHWSASIDFATSIPGVWTQMNTFAEARDAPTVRRDSKVGAWRAGLSRR
jgi:hypothetical protein